MERLDQLIEKFNDEVDASTSTKRIVTDGFEAAGSRLDTIKTDLMTRGERKKRSLQMKEATSGPKWFDMPTKELSVEDKLTLDAIKMREIWDPSRFYKKKSTDKISKQFQIGTVIADPIDYYSSRATRKERKPNLVDELIEDSKFKKSVKKRYRAIKVKKVLKDKIKQKIERSKKKALKNKAR